MAESLRAIALRRGYLAIEVRQREPIGRGLKRAFNEAAKKAWTETAQYFHDHFRDERFTPEHAVKAGYAKRRGQGLTPGSKEFKRSYYGRKLASDRGGGYGKANPLVFSGVTRRAVQTQYRIAATSKGGKVRYAGARALNFRNPNSRIRMNEEFRRLLPEEARRLADVYDSALDTYLKQTEN